MELESRLNNLQSELDTATPTSLTRRNIDPSTWLPRGPARHVLTGHRNPVTSVAFHPIFSVLASSSEDSTIKIWDWELGELERTIKGHTKAVLDVDFGGPKAGVLLASCSSDLTIKLWDPNNEYKNIRTLTGHDHSVSAVRFIPSAAGEYLVSASRDKTLRIWEVATGYCIKTIHGHVDWIRDVAPSFDGRWLLSAGNDQVSPPTHPTMINLLTLQSDYPSLGRLNRRTQSHSPWPRTRNRMLRLRPTHLLPVPRGHRRPQKAPSTNILLRIHSNRQPRQIRTSVGLPGHAPQDTARSR